jgi:hypothetical protein
MSAFIPRPYRVASVLQLFNIRRDPAPERLGSLWGGRTLIHFTSNAFTLVMNRNVRESVQLASTFALGLAQKYPERRVVLVNTYAGEELLARSFASAFEKCAMELPEVVKRFVAETPVERELAHPYDGPAWEKMLAEEEAAKKNSTRPSEPPPNGVLLPLSQLSLRGSPRGEENNSMDVIPTQEFLPNLRVVSFPTGAFNMEVLKEQLGEGSGQIVIWNSFEYSDSGSQNV